MKSSLTYDHVCFGINRVICGALILYLRYIFASAAAETKLFNARLGIVEYRPTKNWERGVAFTLIYYAVIDKNVSSFLHVHTPVPYRYQFRNDKSENP